jgi:hypothetical protein
MDAAPSDEPLGTGRTRTILLLGTVHLNGTSDRRFQAASTHVPVGIIAGTRMPSWASSKG